MSLLTYKKIIYNANTFYFTDYIQILVLREYTCQVRSVGQYVKALKAYIQINCLLLELGIQTSTHSSWALFRLEKSSCNNKLKKTNYNK